VAKGQIVALTGRVLSPTCQGIEGAVIELWQADPNGLYNHENERKTVNAADLDPNFAYWGTAKTDATGTFSVRTIVPGAYPADRGWWRPPHLHWRIQAPGANPLITQSYFDGDAIDGIEQIRAYNDVDRILNMNSGFEEGYRGRLLDQARKRVRSELVVNFSKPAADQVPQGAIVFGLT
jgi:protocatechuate 3,4-dioxygenase beta subunit